MIIILFRVFIIIAIVILLYTAHQYYHNPRRKLRNAKKNNKFFFLDEHDNSKKNLEFVYKGCLFEGEKYLGTTADSFNVVNIHIFVHDPSELLGITKDELTFLEREIHKHYPHATINWKHPINQLTGS